MNTHSKQGSDSAYVSALTLSEQDLGRHSAKDSPEPHYALVGYPVNPWLALHTRSRSRVVDERAPTQLQGDVVL